MGKKKGASSSDAAKVSRDWTASAISNRDINRLRALGFISASEDDIRLPGAVSCPKPPKGFTVMFVAFLFCGLSLPAHEFLRSLLFFYGIQLWQLTPNSILHLSIFITVCEAFLGIDPHWGLWRKIFYVKRRNDNNAPLSSVALAFDKSRVISPDLSAEELRDEVRRLTCLSMKDNIILTSARPPYDLHHLPTEAPSVTHCYPPPPESGVVLEDDDDDSEGTEDAQHALEDSDVQEEEAAEDDTFLRSRRRKQIRDDFTQRLNQVLAEEIMMPMKLLRLLLSDDDDVPLAKRAKLASERAASAKESNPSPAKSTPPLRTSVEKIPVSKVIPPGDAPTPPAGRDHPIYVTVDAVADFAEQFTRLEAENSQLRKAVKSSADQVLEANRLATDTKNENALLKEEVKRLKRQMKDEQDARRAAAAAVDKKEGVLRESVKDLFADALSLAAESNVQVLGLLQKTKGALSRLYSMIFPKMKQDKTLDEMADAFLVDPSEPVEVLKRRSRLVGAVLTFQLLMGHGMGSELEKFSKALPVDDDNHLVDLEPFKRSAITCANQLLKLVDEAQAKPVPESAPGSSDDESGLVRRLRDQVSCLNKDITSLRAMAALVKKRGEIATAIEQYALDGLHIASESLGFVASDATEENRKIHEEVEAMTDVAHPTHGLWLHRPKAVVMAKFKYRVEKAHYYFNKYHAHLTMVWNTLFPLDQAPETLSGLFTRFKSPERIRQLVRKELLAGAELAFASILACHPSLDLKAVANTERSLGQYYDVPRGPAYTIVSRMESCLKKELKAHWDRGARL
ncbi:hypothetical protein QYE76_025461 [Lolium multiflorum]|uniref:Transposase (putative) gypsy type domain-containing protein n=1 Tax=Lolium multiflorum TaxID=4521 RepID=A0AAD8RGV1_LOLMU|nr:hypothetical protein QYE76_025461 [Lolium multiflorum]